MKRKGEENEKMRTLRDKGLEESKEGMGSTICDDHITTLRLKHKTTILI